jgi:hypothetical protein
MLPWAKIPLTWKKYSNGCSVSGSWEARDSEGGSMYEEDNKAVSFKSVSIHLK